MKTKTKKLGNRIRELKDARGWSFEQLARETHTEDGGGVSMTTLILVANGKPCSELTKSRIARAFGLSVEEIFND